MSLSNRSLRQAARRMKPKRSYKAPHGTKIEVDGLFVRIDERLSKDFKNPDADGFVRVHVEDLLQDPAIVRCARVSTGRDSKEFDDKGIGLIRRLFNDYHVTPFETGVEFRFNVRVPICYARHWFRVFGSHNEFSGRYSTIDGDYFVPKNCARTACGDLIKEGQAECDAAYRKLLELGIAKEMARFAVPASFFTKFYMKVSIRHLLELLMLEPNPEDPFGAAFAEIKKVFAQVLRDYCPFVMDQVEPILEGRKIVHWHPDALEAKTMPMHASVRELIRDAVGSVHLMDVWGNEDAVLAGMNDIYDARNGFGHCGMRFLFHTPIFWQRQAIRHRNANWTEFPVDFDEIVKVRDFFNPTGWRDQTGKTMDYLIAPVDAALAEQAHGILDQVIGSACNRYETLRKECEPDVASLILPYCFRQRSMASIDGIGLANLLSLRMDTHAQLEIRNHAEAMGKAFEESFPRVHAEWMRYWKYGTFAGEK